MRTLLLLPLLFGCPAAGDKIDDTAGGDADTDTDADSDTDADTDTDVDLGACPAYSGYTAAGRTWEWAYNEETEAELGPGGWTMTLDSLGADGAWTVTMDADYTIEGFDSYTTSSTMRGSCDAEGLWFEGVSSTTSYVFGGNETTIESETAYDSPYLALPAGLTDGSTWSATVSGSTTSGSTTTPFSYTLDGEVVGAESIEVPAGTFDTLELRQTTEFGASSSWAHVSVGAVASESAELISY